MSHLKQKPKGRPSSVFFTTVAVLLAALATGVVILGTRALAGDRPATKAALPVEVSSEEGTPSPAPIGQSPRAERRGPPEPPRPTGPDLRSAVQEAVVARVAEVRDAATLTKLLTDLEQTARSKGRVTAFEVEPGMAAIRSLYGNDDAELMRRTNEFAERMTKLSASFQPLPQPTALAQPPFNKQPPQGATP